MGDRYVVKVEPSRLYELRLQPYSGVLSSGDVRPAGHQTEPEGEPLATEVTRAERGTAIRR